VLFVRQQFKNVFNIYLTSLCLCFVMFQMNQLAGTAVLEQLSSSSVSISPLANIPTIHRPKHEGICSSCNSKKRLMQTLNQTAAAVAILADAAALLKFKQLGVGLHEDTPRCFRTCDMCYRKFTCALKVARMKAGDIEELRDVSHNQKLESQSCWTKASLSTMAKNAGDCLFFVLLYA
jgi:hypothetical protein